MKLAACFVFASCSASIWAADIDVPADEPTLQDAVDAASNGDTIILATGTYTSITTVNGKTLTIRSADPATQATVDATILSGDTDSDGVPNRQILRLRNGADVTIDGLTFEVATNAIDAIDSDLLVKRSTFDDNTAAKGDDGAAIWFRSSPSTTLEDLTIENTTFTGNTARWGGAVLASASDVTITDSVFDGNTAIGEITQLVEPFPQTIIDFQGSGGAAFIAAADGTSITGCTFTNNESVRNTGIGSVLPANGGALRHSGQGGMQLADSYFAGNVSPTEGSAVFLVLDTGVVEVQSCTFFDNQNDHSLAASGGGFSLKDSLFDNNDGAVSGLDVDIESSAFINTSDGLSAAVVVGREARIYNSEFHGNSTTNGAAAALNVNDGLIVNSRFSENDSDSGPGAISASGDFTVAHCTLVNNIGGGGMVINASPTAAKATVVENSIVWESTVPTTALVQNSGLGTLSVEYSIVRGGHVGGLSVLNQDPLLLYPASAGPDGWGDDPATTTIDESANDFFEGSFQLEKCSPAIDYPLLAGLPSDSLDLDNDSNTTEFVPFDIEGNTRRIDDPDTSDANDALNAPVPDVGAVEYQAGCSWVDWNGDGIIDNGDLQNGFVASFLASDPRADVNCDGVLDNGDIRYFTDTFLACVGS